MKKIAVVTSTRAEYGLLAPVVKELRKYENDNFSVDLIVTGTHLSDEFGHTIDEIKADGTRIDVKISIPVKSNTVEDISNNQAEVLVKFTRLFSVKHYNAVMVLGDRYEILAVAIAAGNTHTPIFHLCGGDTTEGAIDEWVRHSITKMSYLHFPSNDDSRKRVIQLGEDPSRVFNFGSTSIDNILHKADMGRIEALESVGLEDCRYAVCTYHPVTMETADVKEQIDAFLDTIKVFPEIEFIVTKSNADQGGREINKMLDAADLEIRNLHVFASLGVRRYLSLMKYAEFVLGNSSSGIIETPAFHIPTVNIGDRQKGRLQVESIINCNSDKNSIVEAIHLAMSREMKEKCQQTVSPYGNGTAAVQIAAKAVETIKSGNIDLKKKFFDINFEVRKN